MKCEVQRVYKNPRFRILKIDEETYILDMGKSIWKTLFPFLTWIVPNTIYKVDGEEINSKMKYLEREKSNDKSLAILGTGIGIFLANLLRPLTEYFNIQSTMLVNSVIATFMMLLIVLIRVYIGKKYKKKFYEKVTSNLLLKKRIFIRPRTFKHVIQSLFIYLFILLFFLSTLVLFITDGNMMLIIVATFFFFTLTVVNATTILDGPTPVRFR
ncbi:DUF443 family protein [Gracilibacillus suaedae]|uniref:DUF443 family protein n=1 Tax=Gracilibacillus suaedae TaxID=2820273 RepID=UPI001ABDC3C4|nr:DUF443 family protein [Gracilibacillus suaedae]